MKKEVKKLLALGVIGLAFMSADRALASEAENQINKEIKDLLVNKY